MKSKSQIDFDCLHYIHDLDKAERIPGNAQKSLHKNNNILHKMPSCDLTQYFKNKIAIEMAKFYKTLVSPTCIRYKFGIWVPRGIKNAIKLDRKNGNTLWEDAIKTELK